LGYYFTQTPGPKVSFDSQIESELQDPQKLFLTTPELKDQEWSWLQPIDKIDWEVIGKEGIENPPLKNTEFNPQQIREGWVLVKSK